MPPTTPPTPVELRERTLIDAIEAVANAHMGVHPRDWTFWTNGIGQHIARVMLRDGTFAEAKRPTRPEALEALARDFVRFAARWAAELTRAGVALEHAIEQAPPCTTASDVTVGAAAGENFCTVERS